MNPPVALLLQVTFTLAFYRSYPTVLIVAKSKENIYDEYVNFCVEIIVKFFLNYLMVKYSA